MALCLRECVCVEREREGETEQRDRERRDRQTERERYQSPTKGRQTYLETQIHVHTQRVRQADIHGLGDEEKNHRQKT